MHSQQRHLAPLPRAPAWARRNFFFYPSMAWGSSPHDADDHDTGLAIASLGSARATQDISRQRHPTLDCAIPSDNQRVSRRVAKLGTFVCSYPALGRRFFTCNSDPPHHRVLRSERRQGGPTLLVADDCPIIIIHVANVHIR